MTVGRLMHPDDGFKIDSKCLHSPCSQSIKARSPADRPGEVIAFHGSGRALLRLATDWIDVDLRQVAILLFGQAFELVFRPAQLVRRSDCTMAMVASLLLVAVTGMDEVRAHEHRAVVCLGREGHLLVAATLVVQR